MMLLLSCLPANPKPVLLSSCFVCHPLCCHAIFYLCVWLHAHTHVMCLMSCCIVFLSLSLFCFWCLYIFTLFSSVKPVNTDCMPLRHFLEFKITACNLSLGWRARSQRQIRNLLPAHWEGRMCRMWNWDEPRAAVLLQCSGDGMKGVEGGCFIHCFIIYTNPHHSNDITLPNPINADTN